MAEADYTLTPVRAVPADPRTERKGRYYPIIQDFISSGMETALLDVQWLGEEYTYGQLEGCVLGLRNAVKRLQAPVKVCSRGGDIYLVRIDPNATLEEKPALLLAQERKKRGWTKAELSRQSGLNASQVGMIESGRLQPYEGQLLKLARALDWPETEADRLLKVVP